jgi:hypothetical protein
MQQFSNNNIEKKNYVVSLLCDSNIIKINQQNDNAANFMNAVQTKCI